MQPNQAYSLRTCWSVVVKACDDQQHNDTDVFCSRKEGFYLRYASRSTLDCFLIGFIWVRSLQRFNLVWISDVSCGSLSRLHTYMDLNRCGQEDRDEFGMSDSQFVTQEHRFWFQSIWCEKEKPILVLLSRSHKPLTTNFIFSPIKKITVNPNYEFSAKRQTTLMFFFWRSKVNRWMLVKIAVLVSASKLFHFLRSQDKPLKSPSLR